MGSDRLTFQSFQQNQEILRAVNTLSIHLKLTLDGMADDDRLQAVEHSIAVLSAFMEKLERVSHETDNADDVLVLGVDPKLQEFARSYLTARRQRRFHSRLFTNSIGDIKGLLSSTDPKDQKTLVNCLSDLRVLVEEHMRDDVDHMLGAI